MGFDRGMIFSREHPIILEVESCLPLCCARPKNGGASTKAVKSRDPKPNQALPSNRIAFQKQVEILKAFVRGQ